MLLQDSDDEHRIAFICLFLGLFLLTFGLTSYFIRGRIFLSSAVLALASGIALGPFGTGILHILPSSWEDASESDKSKEALLWFTRIILGIQVLSGSVTLPRKLIVKPRIVKSLLTLLGPVMLISIGATAVFAKLVLREFNWLECLTIAACLAPTDPVLAASVVKGSFAENHVPPFLRDLIVVESSINDGSATPYIMLPVLLLTSHNPAKEYILSAILWETVFAAGAGFAIGSMLRILWDFAKARDWVDKESRLVWTLALALFTTGLLTLIDSNEILACFFCGAGMNWNGHLHEDDLHTHFSEGIDTLLDVSVFTTLGTVLPWSIWTRSTPPITLPRLFAFAALTILFRRLPAVFSLQRFIPEIRSNKEAGFVGWFGPMGIGALYYALKVSEMFEEGDPLKQQLFPIIAWIVFLSTIVHGTTVPLFALGSSLNPNLHPRFLVQNDAEEPDEQTPLANQGQKRKETGNPITRAEMERILSGGGEQDRESLDSRQADELLNRDTGLGGKDGNVRVRFGRGRISVFNEGSRLVICDEEGNVVVRKIQS